MTRTLTASAIAGAILLALTGSAFATTGEFDNMCTMGLASHKIVHTNCSVNTNYQGKTYCFGNEKAKAEFMKNPSGNLAKAEAFYSKHQG